MVLYVNSMRRCMKSIMKRVVKSVTSIALIAAMTLGLTTTGSYGQNDVRGAGADEQNGVTIGVMTSASEAEPATVLIPGVNNPENPIEVPLLKDADEQAALVGTGAENYFLGTASLFALFAKDTVDIQGGPDCEGRIATDTLLFNGNGYPIFSGAKSTSGEVNEGLAGLICNNFDDELLNISMPQRTVIVHKDIKGLGTITYKQMYAVGESVFDFESEFETLKAKSAQLANLQSNLGTIDISDSGMATLTGTNKYINVFSFDGEEWNKGNIKRLNIYVPEGSYTIINVSGEKITYNITTLQGESSFFFTNDNGNATEAKIVYSNNDAKSRLLFNFYEATEVELPSSSIGNILAPSATVSNALGGHCLGQIIAENIVVRDQQDYMAFLMPASYIDNADKDVVKYTAHYVYLGTDGNYYEIPSANFLPATPENGLGNGYDNEEVLTTLTKSGAFNNVWQNVTPYQKEATLLQWKVYTDGQNIYNATTGDALLNADTYKKQFSHVTTLNAGEDYTFNNSNVYFVAQPVTDVKVDITFVDGDNLTGRPESLVVTLKDKNGTVIATTTVDATDIVTDNKSVNINGTTVSGDVTATAVFENVPVIDANGREVLYASSLQSGDMILDVTAPKNYYAPENTSTVTGNDSTGDVVGHIVLARDYDITFSVVDQDGVESDVAISGYEDLLAGKSVTIPNLPTDKVGTLSAEYKVIWVDQKTGTRYNAGDSFTVPARDSHLQAVIMLDETTQIRPRYAYDFVKYMGDHKIPGNMLYQRIQADYADSSTMVYYWNCTEEQVKEDTTGTYYYMTFMTGVTADLKAVTLNMSFTGYDEEVTFTKLFNTQQDQENDVTLTFDPFGKNTPDSKKVGYQDLFVNDEYIDEYVGMVQYRFVIPAEYAEDILYITAYYDYDNPQIYWGRTEFSIIEYIAGFGK